MSDSKPVSPAQLSGRTGTIERFIREWLANQAARGYITYDHNTGKYALPPKQALALADGNSPFFVPGGFQATTAFFEDEPKITEAFCTGKDVDQGQHNPSLYQRYWEVLQAIFT